MAVHDPRKQAVLEQMGIQRWELRELPVDAPPQPVSSPPPQAASAAVSDSGARRDESIASMSWQKLEKAVAGCRLCALSESRTHTVFGSGNPNADLMIIGEAPGAEEDRQGLPFVGRAGQLLTEMLIAIGLTRDQVYIANTLKCRPPNNRDPLAEEVQRCEPYLLRQVELIQPKLILALGRVAAHNILKTSDSLARLRTREHRFHGSSIPVFVSYHPAYLLRSPAEKRKAWDDLKKVRALLAR